MKTIAAIIGGALALVRDRPGSILIWGLAYIVAWILFYIALFIGLFAFGAPDTFVARPAGGSAFGAMFGLFAAVYLFMFFITSLMMCTVFRAVLRPHEPSFFSLRLGMDEVRLTGLFLIVLVATIVLWFVAILLLTFLQSAILLASAGNETVAGWLSAGLGLVVLGFTIYYGVRLSMIFPMTFYSRRITIDSGWELSRGRFWVLFLSYLLITVVIVLLFFAAAYPLVGQYWIDVVRAGNDPMAQAMAQQTMNEHMASMPRGVLVLDGLLLVAAGMVAYVLSYGVQASAARVFLTQDGVFDEYQDSDEYSVEGRPL